MDITVTELKEKLNKEENFVLIDVREPYEHEEFNVGGQLIPLNSIPGAVSNLMEHQDDEVVVYCRSGGRSGMAQNYLRQMGFSNVRNLTGGMLAWKKAFQ